MKDIDIGSLVSFKYKGEILNGKIIGIFSERVSIKTPDIIYSLNKSAITEAKEGKKVTKKKVEVKDTKQEKVKNVSLTGFDALKQGVLI